MKERLLVIGASGLLGPFLVEALNKTFDVFSMARSRGDFLCDIRDTPSVMKAITDLEPEVIVNAAALTNIDWCEENPVPAFEVNGHAVRRIVAGLRSDIHFIQISTDQVYPDLPGPHDEEDAAGSPVNVYGASKKIAEISAVGRLGCLILRVNFFGVSRSPGRSSLTDIICDKMQKQEPMVFFEDSLFTPLHMATLANIVEKCAIEKVSGVYNIGCRDGASKADFAEAVCAHLGLSTGSSRRGRASESSLRAPRPSDLRMNSSRLEARLGCQFPTLMEEILKLKK